MWEAFMEQQKGTPEELDREADLMEQAVQEWKEQREKEAMEQLHSNQSLFEVLDLRTNLKKEDIEQKTEVHPNLKDYDHSLEKVRIKFEQPESDPDKPMLIEDVRPATDDEPTTIEMSPFQIDWDGLAAQLGL
jgi:hypothetical protein